MKDYSAMSDLEINKAVAAFKPELYYVSLDDEPVYLEVDPAPAYTGSDYNEVVFDPCNNPADAWPIIHEEMISIVFDDDGYDTPQSAWCKATNPMGNEYYGDIHRPLRAAMIVYLQMMEQK